MIIVKHAPRDIKKWQAVVPSTLQPLTDQPYADLAKLLAVIHKTFPADEIMIDDRDYVELGNGMVLLTGEQDLQPVTFVGRKK